MVLAVPKDYRSKPGEYGETKRQKQFLLTPSASQMLDTLAGEYSTTRSDLLERVVRGFHELSKNDRDEIMLKLGVTEEQSDG